jgi:predicted RNase H-like HicB family nuclease
MQRKRRRRAYLVYFEKESDGTWSAHVPALPGCHSQGDTLEEAKANVVEAIQAYLESVKKDDLPLYDPSEAFMSQVEVEA